MNILLKYAFLSSLAQSMPKPLKKPFTDGLIRWLYSALLVVIIPFSFVNLLVRWMTGKTGYNAKKLERYGFIKKPQRGGGILIHCVSVGEVVAASRLIGHMLAVKPDLVVTFTTTTPTGAERVRQIYGNRVNHFYLPYDLQIAMHNLLVKVQPEKVLITEVELWPNFIHAAYRKSIPVYVINARMTDKSRDNYHKLSPLFSPMLEKVYRVCAQGQRDYDNYLKLGIDKRKLFQSNNIKFDLEVSVSDEQREALKQKNNPQNKTLLLAGSTHDPEEKQILSSFTQLVNAHGNTLLIIVPRHPQRFEKVWQQCQESGLRAYRSSVYQGQDADVILVDEMGLLANLYSIADLAFVGGSIADKGGHNALEATVYSVPVLMGPHTYNNPEICKVLAEAGALQLVQNEHELTDKLSELLSDKDIRKQKGQAGFDVMDSNKGAIDKTISVINAPLDW